jgi:hypothetical protein
MPPDITGPGGATGGVPIPPAAPVRPAEPTRALVPVERPGPRLPPSDSPLGRSGVSLEDLLFAPDVLETREAVAPVALEVGLETARRQLLQRLPTEALMSLDGIWGRAVTSEEGWYLRSGALTVLGHPLEGERVAGEGLETQPHSLALRLLQSVARAVVGDLSGARAALHPALDRAPSDPVLLAQQAVVLARQGHRDDAADVLVRLAREVPDHPALAWARAAVRAAGTDRTRAAARPAVDAPGAPVDAIDLPAADETMEDGDMVTTAFRRLGGQLRAEDAHTLQQAARTLLRACSAGGALASACTPQEAHAARQVLSSLLVVLRGDAAAAGPHSPLTTIVQQLLPLLRPSGGSDSALDAVRAAEAERLLRRQGDGVPPVVRACLTVLVRGAADRHRSSEAQADPGTGAAARPSIAAAGGKEHEAATAFVGTVLDEQELGPLVPVRLGLSLLAETSATRAFERRQESLDGDAGAATFAGALGGSVAQVRADGSARSGAELPTGGVEETNGMGWGGARAAGQLQGDTSAARRPLGAALPAIVLGAGALGAAVNGAGTVALLFGGAALWLALRRPAGRQ